MPGMWFCPVKIQKKVWPRHTRIQLAPSPGMYLLFGPGGEPLPVPALWAGNAGAGRGDGKQSQQEKKGQIKNNRWEEEEDKIEDEEDKELRQGWVAWR